MNQPAFKLIRCLLAGFLFLVSQGSFAAGARAGLIEWQDWDETIFQRAQRQGRMVLLDMDAAWCHWCHVMEAKTYSHPDVAGLVNRHFIPVRVDADANPDLANRYGRWGWPATIVFSAEGEEIVKRRGYIPIIGMLSMLEAIIADPSPGPSVWNEPIATPATDAALAPALRKKLEQSFYDLYDARYGGWGRIHKFVNAAATEYAIEQARLGRREHELIARLTLQNGLHLIDPAWGGVYQYSDQLDWRSPHFEKIMFYQAENLRLYALAYARWRDPAYLEAIESITKFIDGFMLDPGGGFYTSQDADLSLEVDGHQFFAMGDSERRARGIPRVDRNIYARENGWMIRALVAVYDATGDSAALNRALAATRFIISNRRLSGGGFSHGQHDRGGPFLGDNQAMAQAFIALHQSTGERRWLKQAATTLDFIERNFRNESGGYNSALIEAAATGVFNQSTRQVDEVAALARSANLAMHYLGDQKYRRMAEHAMRYLAAPELSEIFVFQPSILLADYEVNSAPVHITIVGAKQDLEAKVLFDAARGFPGSYLRLDWWDRNEGSLPNANVVYPGLARAAAFVCSDNACSIPLYDGAEIGPKITELYALEP